MIKKALKSWNIFRERSSKAQLHSGFQKICKITFWIRFFRSRCLFWWARNWYGGQLGQQLNIFQRFWQCFRQLQDWCQGWRGVCFWKGISKGQINLRRWNTRNSWRPCWVNGKNLRWLDVFLATIIFISRQCFLLGLVQELKESDQCWFRMIRFIKWIRIVFYIRCDSWIG